MSPYIAAGIISAFGALAIGAYAYAGPDAKNNWNNM
jgi:hypothetical protein